MSELLFTSAIASLLDGFVQEKHACGYKYDSEMGWLRRFDAFWKEEAGDAEDVSREALERWCAPTGTEGASSLRNRITVTREFARYLNGLGMPVWIPDRVVNVPKPVIHVLNTTEIRELFAAIDDWVPALDDARKMQIAKEYPVAFRLILSTGLRNGEAVALRLDNVDADAGTIRILGAKRDKDRIVWVAEDMMATLQRYMIWRMETFELDERWLFPGMVPGTHLSSASLRTHFRRAWNQTPSSVSAVTRPTVHALRHTYAVLRINAWISAGRNLQEILPYLARQLGHASPAETIDVYYHQVQESLAFISRNDHIADNVLPEVAPR